MFKPFFQFIAWCMVVCCLVSATFTPAIAEQLLENQYIINEMFTHKEGEEIVLLAPISFYSGDIVYKGNSGLELGGACVMHAASLMISNLHGEETHVQEIAVANNKGYNKDRNWTPYVSWGRIETPFHVDFTSFDLVRFSRNLNKSQYPTQDDKRQAKMQSCLEALTNHGKNLGIMLHFNQTKSINGVGRRHTVVLLGVVKKDGKIIDFIVSDSSVPAPEGIAIRMSESTLPTTLIPEKQLATLDKEDLPFLLIDFLVSYRYITHK